MYIISPTQLIAVYGLQRLTRFRYHLSETLTREKLYTLGLLFLTFSEFGAASPFSDPFGATSQAVLEELSLDELATKPMEELTAYLARNGHGRFATPEAVARTLQQAACSGEDKWPAGGPGSRGYRARIRHVWRSLSPMILAASTIPMCPSITRFSTCKPSLFSLIQCQSSHD